MKITNQMLRGLALALSVAILGVGCGPISAFSSVRKASIEIEKAKTAGADKRAVYEFVSAQEYLAKAREEQGYADYQMAVDLAKKAADFATKAQKVATAKDKDEATSSGSNEQKATGAEPRRASAEPGGRPKPVPVQQKIAPAGGR